MREQRWFPIAALAVGLFAINAVTRLVIRLAFSHDDAAQGRASLVMFALIGVTLAVWTFVSAQGRRAIDFLVPDWVLAAVGGMLLTVLVGPFISGDQPFSSGAGDFFAQIWLYAAFAIVGTVLGYGVAVMLGRDYRSRALSAFTESRTTKPRKVVRR